MGYGRFPHNTPQLHQGKETKIVKMGSTLALLLPRGIAVSDEQPVGERTLSNELTRITTN